MPESSTRAVIFDLDGTVYRGTNLIAGADRVVSQLRAHGVDIRFLTNKAIDRRTDYCAKLARLGVSATLDDVINSGWVTAQYLRQHHPDRRALVIGEEPLVSELEEAGIETTTETTGSIVVASMDRGFTYDKLDLALESLQGDVPFVATNPDRTCPVEGGEIPDAAGMIAAIEAVSGRTVDEILGKPSPIMAETILGDLAVDPSECLMVGDRPETDIEMGNRAGMQTALVLSGVTSREDLGDLEQRPDYVVESIADIPAIVDPPRMVTDE